MHLVFGKELDSWFSIDTQVSTGGRNQVGVVIAFGDFRDALRRVCDLRPDRPAFECRSNFDPKQRHGWVLVSDPFVQPAKPLGDICRGCATAFSVDVIRDECDDCAAAVWVVNTQVGAQ